MSRTSGSAPVPGLGDGSAAWAWVLFALPCVPAAVETSSVLELLPWA